MPTPRLTRSSTPANTKTQDNNLYNLRARQYDTATGRFLARDPASHPLTDGTRTPYAYASDQPTVFVDPTGLDSDPVCQGLWCSLVGTIDNMGHTFVCEIKHPFQSAALAGTWMTSVGFVVLGGKLVQVMRPIAAAATATTGWDVFEGMSGPVHIALPAALNLLSGATFVYSAIQQSKAIADRC